MSPSVDALLSVMLAKTAMQRCRHQPPSHTHKKKKKRDARDGIYRVEITGADPVWSIDGSNGNVLE